ncbi:MAG: hypothetical protein M0011_09325 [Elusimicrobia bacterium]|nr:hypothetical protein [Elusimicrobiota bacterium]
MRKSRNKTASIPAEIKTSLDLPPLWGRLGFLSPEEAEVISHFELRTGKIVALGFELGRARFEEVRGRIDKAMRDGDGYFTYSISFLAPEQRALIRTAIEQSL